MVGQGVGKGRNDRRASGAWPVEPASLLYHDRAITMFDERRFAASSVILSGGVSTQSELPLIGFPETGKAIAARGQ